MYEWHEQLIRLSAVNWVGEIFDTPFSSSGTHAYKIEVGVTCKVRYGTKEDLLVSRQHLILALKEDDSGKLRLTESY